MKKRLTRARLRELLHYDSDTGEFRWWKRVGNEVRLGERAGYLEIRVVVPGTPAGLAV